MTGLWKEVGHFPPSSIETVCLWWLKVSQGFILGRYFPAGLLFVLKASLLFLKWLMVLIYVYIFWHPSTDHPLENAFTWMSKYWICFVLSAWEPFPLTWKNKVVPMDTPLVWLPFVEVEPLNKTQLSPMAMGAHLATTETNLKSTSLEPVAHINMSHSNLHWVCVLKHLQAHAFEHNWIFRARVYFSALSVDKQS